MSSYKDVRSNSIVNGNSASKNLSNISFATSRRDNTTDKLGSNRSLSLHSLEEKHSSDSVPNVTQDNMLSYDDVKSNSNANGKSASNNICDFCLE